MKPPVSLRKKIETDGTRLSRVRRVPSVSIFFLTETGRFHNFSQFHTWNHNQFHFLKQKNRNHSDSFSQFPVKLTTQKKVFVYKPKSLLLPSFIKKFTLVHLILCKNTSTCCFWKNQGFQLFPLIYFSNFLKKLFLSINIIN